MKKLFLVIAAAMLTATVSAQRTAITANKAQDNWYIGLNAGAATPMVKYGNDWGFMKGFAPKVGLRVGKNLTTVFGLALDVDAYAKQTEKFVGYKNYTFFDAVNIDLMGTFNLSNLFGGYKGEPRAFEVIGLVGGGYSRGFGYRKAGGVNGKAAIDFAFNLGTLLLILSYNNSLSTSR